MREPGAIDTTALREAIPGQEENAWNEDDFRQKSLYVHHNFRSIVMLSLDDTKWPERAVHQGTGWDRLAGVAVPIMQGCLIR